MGHKLKGRYWRPHYFVKYLSEHNCYMLTLHEVHYENNKPVMWTGAVELTAGEESLTESVEQMAGIIDIYAKAKNYCLYKEVEYLDEKTNETKLKLEEVFMENINIRQDADKTLILDYCEEGESGVNAPLDLDNETVAKLEGIGIDVNTNEGLEKLYKVIGDFVDSLEVGEE